jgi:hypothetical protein
MGTIHAARFDASPRLQRVFALLSDGDEYTTRRIVREADVCAVNSIMAELRQNSIPVTCRILRRGVYTYQLTELAGAVWVIKE